MRVAEEARRAQKLAKKVRRRVERMSESEGATKELAPVVGKTTAAVMVAAPGDPRGYGSATAYLKSTDLNLKEKSSGKKRQPPHSAHPRKRRTRAHDPTLPLLPSTMDWCAPTTPFKAFSQRTCVL